MSSSSPARTSPARTPRALALAAAALLGGGVLTACGTDGDAGAGDDGPTVVASTTVYADIAEQVAGDNASVESVISDPAADPHSYEASPADAAAVAGADLVVYNGAGYDAFVDMALDNAGDVPVVRGVDEFERVTGASVDGHDHAEEDHADSDDHADGDHSHEAAGNEHVWFSLPTAAAVAERVAEELAAIDSGNAEQYRDNARAFADALTPLEARLDEIHDRGHFPYAQTERVGAHLFEAAHLTDLTPRGFLASVEDDTDPSAADLAAMLDLLAERRVAFLAFNTQTETSVTARVRDAAEDADLVVVDLTETLPEGADYIGWMTGIVDDVSGALADATPVGDGGH
ncbi:zinc/manganese transport system substrate-binding protein [Dietzia kunjamensis]|uniref:metal ABC transporter solute-binding protein, Zn/Mn family n=1 Tax=Dietzia kunjamensis TaxID=322509 RepID=UPI000E756812|nr:zinc ABC transporter substrate-binding protein [Dietzia kunjamensis]MBB1011942.1 zinc ABC transporter solute-binding protein [Dietzia kunjamensis]RKE65265.1 zinc/manganese transport system substrate-binding protein [Dietzia kunjamensis]